MQRSKRREFWKTDMVIARKPEVPNEDWFNDNQPRVLSILGEDLPVCESRQLEETAQDSHRSEAEKEAAPTKGHLYIARETLNKYGDGNIIFAQSRFYRWTGQKWIVCDDL